jgi:WD40 repeat protein
MTFPPCFTLRDQYLFSGSVDHSIKMWNIEKLEVVASMPAHDNPVCTLTINGNRLYSGSLKSIKVNLKFNFKPLNRSSKFKKNVVSKCKASKMAHVYRITIRISVCDVSISKNINDCLMPSC